MKPGLSFQLYQRLCVFHELTIHITIRPNLELKTQSKQLVDYLLIQPVFAEPTSNVYF
jgi:hypothetical protein